MALPKKTTGSGAKAEISKDNSAFSLFGSVSKITPPSFTRGTIDVTDMNSYQNNNQMKEFLSDFIEADEMQIEGFFLGEDAGREMLEEAFYSGEEVYIRVTLPPVIGKTMTVQGMITKYQPMGEISPDAGIAFSTSIKPNAKPAMAPVVNAGG